jgi:hypothetical protein
MDYDVCDILNKKLVKIHSHYEGNWTERSVLKNPQLFDKEMIDIDNDNFLNYLTTIENVPDVKIYGHWILRDGKVSGQVVDHEDVARKLLSEGSDHRGKFSATSELLNFSGVIRLLINPGRAMFVQCFTRPSLDQLLTLKDIERQIVANDGIVGWKISDRRNKSVLYRGTSLEKLHSLPWSKIK